MADKLVHYTLRIDRVLLQKLRYVAKYECRSANKEIEQYIKKCVAKFEEQHGKIDVSES